MLTAFDNEEYPVADAIGRWFRELDQRRVYHGAREWLLEVTSILHDGDVLWIQIADQSRRAGSVLLRVKPATSVDQAVRALATETGLATTYPRVVNGLAGKTAV